MELVLPDTGDRSWDSVNPRELLIPARTPVVKRAKEGHEALEWTLRPGPCTGVLAGLRQGGREHRLRGPARVPRRQPARPAHPPRTLLRGHAPRYPARHADAWGASAARRGCRERAQRDGGRR